MTPGEESLDEEDISTDGQGTLDDQDILYGKNVYGKNVDFEEEKNILDENDVEFKDDTPDEEKYIPNDFKSGNRSAPVPKGGGSASTRKAGNAVKEAVNRLDNRERRYGFIASIVAAILWLLLTVPLLIHPAKPHKGQLGTDGIAIYLVVGLLLAGIIFFASWIKRRALLGFAVLFTGFSFGGDLLFAIPFYALGAWLIWRAMKVQRELQAAMQAAGATSSRPVRTRGPLFSRMTRRGEGRQAKAPVVRAAPTASKRYTPPRSAPKSSKRHGK